MKDAPDNYDADDQSPVPPVWRETFDQVVSALMSPNPRDEINAVPNVTFDDRGIEISLYQIKNYPASKVEIGPKSWITSICTKEGDVWRVLVDLHIDGESEVSDLVLSAEVKCNGSLFHFDVGFVYVP